MKESTGSLDKGRVGTLVSMRLRERREDLGLSQREVGRRMYGEDSAGNARRVSQIETRTGSISIYTLYMLANALECDWSELLPPLPHRHTDEG